MFSWRRPKVLTFHTVLPERPKEDALFFYAQPTTGEFEDQVRFLREECAPIDLDEYLGVLKGKIRCPRRAVLVTFDDGFDNSRLAAEILRQHEVPSLLFLAVDYIDDTHVWTWYLALDWLVENTDRSTVNWRGEPFPLTLLSQRKIFRERFKTLYLQAPEADRAPLLQELEAALAVELPERPPAPYRFLDWQAAHVLAQDDPYMEIGSHGRSHHDLTQLSDAVLAREMQGSADRIEEMTGVRPRALSYPDGRHDARVREAAERNYRVAFALSDGARADDLFRQPRVPGLPGPDDAARRVLSPLWPARQALWRWRAERGWI